MENYTDIPVLPLDQWPVHGPDAHRLYQAISSGQPVQAMLLAGPAEATYTFALFLAQLLLCRAGAGRPCGACSSCLQFRAGTHPNWHEVPLDGRSVKTQAIVELQAFLAMRAHGDAPRVYLVPAIDSATPVAANRLLKTLEEPVGDVVALLTAIQARQVLPTILSRCHVYRLVEATGAVSAMAVGEGAQGPDGTTEQQAFAALFLRVVQWTQAFLAHSTPSLVLASEFHKLSAQDGVESPLDLLLAWLDALLHVALTKQSSARFPEYEQQMAEQSALVGGPDLAALIQIVIDTKVRTASHVAGLLNLEQMCIRMRRVRNGLHGGGSPI